MRIVKLDKDTKKDILSSLLKRSPNQYVEYEQIVSDIISDVRLRGDEAVFELTSKFDKWIVNPDNVRVSRDEIEDAYKKVDQKLIDILNEAAGNIRDFHKRQYCVERSVESTGSCIQDWQAYKVFLKVGIC